ncbi:MAG: hypothetical protein KGH75_10490, partial [Rhodospirillales bacterium]|nr:hypothetical protein [Rhodospirillales bacterium]
ANAINSTPIGGTTPAAGAFTTLAASGAITASGGIVVPANNISISNGQLVSQFNGAGTSGYFTSQGSPYTVVFSDATGTPGVLFQGGTGIAKRIVLAASNVLQTLNAAGTVVHQISDAGGVTIPAGQNFSNTIGGSATGANQAASRAIGTAYPNNSGRPMLVHVAATMPAAASYLTLATGTVTYYSGNGSVGGGLSAITAVVKAGDSYTVNTSAGSPSVLTWIEFA